jgi:prepilin-type N-terminal cleavage/methylation domain-containing protein
MYNMVLDPKSQFLIGKLIKTRSKFSAYFPQKDAGFTLIEILVALLMLGILAAIAAPSWVGFTNRQRANKANDFILAAIQEAQQEARRQKLGYSVSFHNRGNIPQIAVHPATKTPDPDKPDDWRSLNKELGIQPGQLILGTNLTDKNKTTSGTSVTYPFIYDSSTPKSITFDYMGNLDLTVKTNTQSITNVQQDNLGNGLIVAVAIASPGNPSQATSIKRCVIVKTLLGSLKTEKDTKCN